MHLPTTNALHTGTLPALAAARLAPLAYTRAASQDGIKSIRRIVLTLAGGLLFLLLLVGAPPLQDCGSDPVRLPVEVVCHLIFRSCALLVSDQRVVDVLVWTVLQVFVLCRGRGRGILCPV